MIQEKVAPLSELLREVRRRRLILIEEESGIEAWSPHTPLPIATRRAIYKHRGALLHLLEASDARVCPSTVLHRRYHHNGVCDACRRLDAALGTYRQVSIAS